MPGGVQAKYRPYPAYKPSGLEWLGDIPEGWKIDQSRRLFSQRKERARPDDEQLTASQKYGIIYQKEFMKIESQRVVQVITGMEILKHVEADDFVISMRSFQGGLEWCRYAGSVSSAYVGVIPQKHIVPAFFSYFFKCKQYIQALQSTSNLVRDGQALRFNNFAQVSLPIVPNYEQTKIAAFLDHETAKIDALIAKQQRLIALLEEKRQAVITHAVTKGLDADAPLRPSGIEWLGDVPEHWEVMKLKYPISVKGGYAFNSKSFTDTGKKVIRIGDIDTRGVISLQDAKCIPSSAAQQFSAYEISAGYILMAMTGATIGKAGWYTESEPALLNQRVGAFECNNEKISSRFFWYVLKSEGYQKYVTLTAFGGAQPNISDTQMLDYSMVLPKMSEQQNIADFLDMESTRFDALSDKARAASNLLRERRTAIISAAVTGKIDLRGWQAPTEASDTFQSEEVLA